MAKKEELIATAKSLGIETKGLTVVQLEKAIAEKQEADTGSETDSTEEVAEPKGYKTEDGRIFGLSKRTPKTLKVLNNVYTQEELLQNKEAMEFLIYGDSSFVEQLK